MTSSSKPLESLAKEDYELLAEFRYTLRKFLGFSEANAISRGVTAQQYQAMLAIEGFHGRNWVTVGELAEQLRTTHHSAVGLVDRMVALRLVRRVKATDDRRRVQVYLTSKGVGILEKLYRVHRNELKMVGPKLITLLQKASVSRPVPVERYTSPACAMPEIED